MPHPTISASFFEIYSKGGAVKHILKMTYNWDKINSVATLLFAVIVSTELRIFFRLFVVKDIDKKLTRSVKKMLLNVQNKEGGGGATAFGTMLKIPKR